jgi:hypothetical protein
MERVNGQRKDYYRHALPATSRHRRVGLKAMQGIQTPIVTDHRWKGEGIVLTWDGSKWLAVFNDFVNLHVSPAGFGDTQEEAVNALKQWTE